MTLSRSTRGHRLSAAHVSGFYNSRADATFARTAPPLSAAETDHAGETDTNDTEGVGPGPRATSPLSARSAFLAQEATLETSGVSEEQDQALWSHEACHAEFLPPELVALSHGVDGASASVYSTVIVKKKEKD